MKKEKFLDIFYKNKAEAQKNGCNIEKNHSNGTSESVLEHLRSLGDEDKMIETVARIEKNMYKTFKEVAERDNDAV